MRICQILWPFGFAILDDDLEVSRTRRYDIHA